MIEIVSLTTQRLVSSGACTSVYLAYFFTRSYKEYTGLRNLFAINLDQGEGGGIGSPPKQDMDKYCYIAQPQLRNF